MDTWKVKLKISDAADPAVREYENKQYEMEFKLDYEDYRERVKAYKLNQSKAYALLWERCTKPMKHKIKGRKNFIKTILNNPINLLKAIKEHSQLYHDNRYSISVCLDSLRALIHCKQKENEPLEDWSSRFRVASEVVESHFGGPIIIKKIAEAMPEYSEDNPQKVKGM